MSDTPKLGRPSKYDPVKHPPLAMELGKLGYTNIEIAYEIGVHIDTLHEWANKHSVFSEAFKIAAFNRHRYYQKLGRENVANKDFNMPLFKFMTKFACQPKAMGRTVHIPGAADTDDVLEHMRLTIKALIREEITPEEAESMVRVFDLAAKSQASVQEFQELSDELKNTLNKLKHGD